MIVTADFLEHHKTHKLVAMAEDEGAPLSLIRLWAYCHRSRRWRFPKLTPEDLAAICHWKSKKISCEDALAASGWVKRLGGGGYIVLGWEEHNRGLIANWSRNPSGKRKPPNDDDQRIHDGHPTGTPRTPRCPRDQTGQEKTVTGSEQTSVEPLDCEAVNGETPSLTASPSDSPSEETSERQPKAVTPQERELMERLSAAVGEEDMKQFGGDWRNNYVRKNPHELSNALNQFTLLEKQGHLFTSKSAWLKDRYRRNVEEAQIRRK